jgi:hypothetical protein
MNSERTSVTERAAGNDTASDIGEDEVPSEAVVRTVASLREEDPADLEPLFETVDPDAIDALLGGDREDGALELRLTYESCEIVVTPDEVRAHLLNESGR